MLLCSHHLSNLNLLQGFCRIITHTHTPPPLPPPSLCSLMNGTDHSQLNCLSSTTTMFHVHAESLQLKVLVAMYALFAQLCCWPVLLSLVVCEPSVGNGGE